MIGDIVALRDLITKRKGVPKALSQLKQVLKKRFYAGGGMDTP